MKINYQVLIMSLLLYLLIDLYLVNSSIDFSGIVSYFKQRYVFYYTYHMINIYGNFNETAYYRRIDAFHHNKVIDSSVDYQIGFITWFVLYESIRLIIVLYQLFVNTIFYIQGNSIFI